MEIKYKYTFLILTTIYLILIFLLLMILVLFGDIQLFWCILLFVLFDYSVSIEFNLENKKNYIFKQTKFIHIRKFDNIFNFDFKIFNYVFYCGKPYLSTRDRLNYILKGIQQSETGIFGYYAYYVFMFARNLITFKFNFKKSFNNVPFRIERINWSFGYRILSNDEILELLKTKRKIYSWLDQKYWII